MTERQKAQKQKLLCRLLCEMDNEPRSSNKKEAKASKKLKLKKFNEIHDLLGREVEIRKTGEPKDRIAYLTKAKEMNTKVGNKYLEALTLEGFGYYYGNTEEYEKALKAANDAILLYQEVAKHHEGVGQDGIGNGFASLGIIYSELGNNEKAIEYYQKAIKLLSRSRRENLLGITYGNLGQTYNRMEEEPEKALKLCQKALKISLKTEDKFEQARNLHNIGNACVLMRQYEKSIEALRKSATIYKKIGHKKAESHCYGDLATCYTHLGKMEIAQRYFKMCVDINRGLNQFASLGMVYGNRGLCYDAIGLAKFLEAFFSKRDYKEFLETSIENYKLAIESTEKILVSLSVDDNRTAFVDRFYRWYDHLTAPFNLLGRSTAALLFLDLGRAKILRHLVYKQVRLRNEDRNSSEFELSWLTIDNREEKKRMKVLAKEVHLLESDATVLFYNFNRSKIFTIWILDANGCVSLKTVDPDPGMLKTAQEQLEDTINKLLDKASTSVPRGYSFFNQSSIVDCEETRVTNNARESRAPAVRSDQLCEELTKETRSRLYKSLIKPVKSFIKGSKLIIVPQRCIYFAPFSSFLDENGRLLSEEYQIQIIPSIHVLAVSMQATSCKQIGGSLFVGDPDASLPSALEEVRCLASLLNGKSLTGRMATKNKVLELMSEATIVHIAAHGDYKSGHIYLAPEASKSSSIDEDLLTQKDVLGCQLVARLVVLSCCHSGMGKVSSEGVLGIARSFLGAGASSVLVTLWPISDTFTKMFMTDFYEKILDGKSACLALKETMNMFQRCGQYTSFLFWGAFEIIGEDVKFTKDEIEEIRRRNKTTSQ